MFVSTTTTGSPPLHGLVKRVPVRDVDEGAAAVEARERRKLHRLPPRPEKVAQRGLDQVGHCPLLARSLALELAHHGVVDVERRLHMESHIVRMALRLAFRAPLLRADVSLRRAQT